MNARAKSIGLDDDAGKRLIARRSELRERLARVKAEMRRESEALSPDFAEQATQRENDEVLDGLRRSSEAELRDIEAALERIKQGRYGICAGCGQRIDVQRLASVPYAVRCGDCAEAAKPG